MHLLLPLPKPLLKAYREVPYLSNNPEGLSLVVLTQSAILVNILHLALKSQELYLKMGGILPPRDKFLSGGTLMLGGNLKSDSTINHKGKMCPLYPIRGVSLFKEIRMPPRDKLCLPHLIHGVFLSQETDNSRQEKILRLRNNLLRDKFPTQPILLKTHLGIPRSPMLLKTL
jgi:hypothetical protein